MYCETVNVERSVYVNSTHNFDHLRLARFHHMSLAMVLCPARRAHKSVFIMVFTPNWRAYCLNKCTEEPTIFQAPSTFSMQRNSCK